jgi:hypothetical protein
VPLLPSSLSGRKAGRSRSPLSNPEPNAGDTPEHWRKVPCCRWQPAVEPEPPRLTVDLQDEPMRLRLASWKQQTFSTPVVARQRSLIRSSVTDRLTSPYSISTGTCSIGGNNPCGSTSSNASPRSRLILLDKRGTGLSDRTRDLPNLETRMDDIRAVMDATHSERAALLGAEEGGQIAAVFAASYPERTRALCLYNTVARATSALDYPWGRTPEEWRDRIAQVRRGWGTVELAEELLGKDFAIPSVGRWWVNYLRLSVSPGAALALYRAYGDTDIREVLPAIRVPTLVLYRPYAREPALDLARRIPGAVA